MKSHIKINRKAKIVVIKIDKGQPTACEIFKFPVFYEYSYNCNFLLKIVLKPTTNVEEKFEEKFHKN